jgi:hypothetical protein
MVVREDGDVSSSPLLVGLRPFSCRLDTCSFTAVGPWKTPYCRFERIGTINFMIMDMDGGPLFYDTQSFYETEHT